MLPNFRFYIMHRAKNNTENQLSLSFNATMAIPVWCPLKKQRLIRLKQSPHFFLNTQVLWLCDSDIPAGWEIISPVPAFTVVAPDSLSSPSPLLVF